MIVDLVLEDERWLEHGLQGLADRACVATLRHLGFDPAVCEVNLLACDDTRIAALNSGFRGKETPTNVLSWPAAALGAETDGDQPLRPEPDITGEIALGDIALAFDTCAREAAEAGKSLPDHASHLVVHGLLHLLGYDHERDADATLMERLETEILGTMGIDDPYSS